MRNLAVLASLLGAAAANRVYLDGDYYRQVCEGMYDKHAWGGPYRPHINIRLSDFNGVKYGSGSDAADADVDISYVIFEYKDLVHLGRTYSETGHKKYVCDDIALSANLCDKSEYGQFISDGDVSNTTIQISKISELGNANLTYPVSSTGYYCVSTFSRSNSPYEGYVNFQNAFGHLSASQIPKLPAYGILTLCYAVTLALYGFQFFKKRDQNQILPLQRYLLGMLAFLTFDTLVVWSYYDLVNRTAGVTWFVTFYVLFLSILSAAKITFSFFLLLLIALGYGVVSLKLSKKIMTRCKVLAGLHFLASLIYLMGSYHTGLKGSTSSSSDFENSDGSASLADIIPLIPVTITLTAYYFLILTSIRQTTANLHKQRQVIKLQLYQNLFRIISFLILLTMAGLVFSSFIFLSMSSSEIIEQNWKGLYFVVDFWPSVTFFGIFLGVAWLWRPTETSYMLAVSQQVSTGEGDEDNDYQHGHEFELDDVSVMSHSDNEEEHRDSFELAHETEAPPKYQAETFETGTAPQASNTLFELADEDEDKHKDALDDSLK